METQDNRKANLAVLIAQHGGTTALAKKLGFANASFLSQMLNGHRAFSEKTARSIEEKLALPRNWLDAVQAHRDAHPEIAAAVNAGLLSKCLVATMRAPGGSSLTTEAVAEIAALALERAIERNAVDVDRDYISQLVKLAARSTPRG